VPSGPRLTQEYVISQLSCSSSGVQGTLEASDWEWNTNVFSAEWHEAPPERQRGALFKGSAGGVWRNS
jgi:hypothetical protein